MRAPNQRSRQRTHLTRRELKAPDEFITATGRILSFAAQHLRTISLILGGLIVCVIIVWGLFAYLHSIEQEAFNSLWQIEAQLRVATDAHAVPVTSVERLQEIAHQGGAGKARTYAWLYLGHVHYRQGDYAAAATAYQQAAARASPASLLWSLASLGTATALEAHGEFKSAQEAYQRVIDAKPTGFLVEAYLGKARVAEQDQDIATALSIYAAVIEQFPAQAEIFGIVDKVETLKGRQ